MRLAGWLLGAATIALVGAALADEPVRELGTLAVGWPVEVRRQIAERMARQVVLVELRDGEVRVAERCRARDRRSEFVHGQGAHARIAVQDRNELADQLPFDRRLGALFVARRGLTVEVWTTGYYNPTPAADVTRDLLDGECTGVTHSLALMSVGAFRLWGADSAGEPLDADGQPAACTPGKYGDQAPPDGCAVPLAAHLEPIKPPPPPAPPASNRREGRQPFEYSQAELLPCGARMRRTEIDQRMQCVALSRRGARSAASQQRFLVEVDTVTDRQSGLLWRRRASPRRMDWAAARDYCHRLPGGDWMLPTYAQLSTLVERRLYPAIDWAVFADVPTPGRRPDELGYWIANRDLLAATGRRAIEFFTGSSTEDGPFFARCVRRP